MPFTLRLYQRFPVYCSVTYNAGPFQGQGTVWNLSCTGWRPSGDLPMRNPSCKLNHDVPRNLFIGQIPCLYSLSRFLILSVFMVQQGCTTPPLEPSMPWSPHIKEDVRAKISTIGVRVGEKLHSVTVELPSKGAASGARRKARMWSSSWVSSPSEALAQQAGKESPGLDGLLLTTTAAGAILVLTPVVAVAGAVMGAFEAPAAPGTVNRELDCLHRMMILGQRHTPPKIIFIPHFPRLAEDNVREGFCEHDAYPLHSRRGPLPHPSGGDDWILHRDAKRGN